MANTRTILVFETPYKLTNYLVTEWVALARQTIERTGRFMVAFSGGRTPIEFYCKLSNIDDFELWRYIHVFVTDERFVPEESNDSNIRMIRQTLLHYVPIPSENIHSVAVSSDSPQTAARLYEEEIRRCFPWEPAIPHFDCMVLGVGSRDGHIASLFTGQSIDTNAQSFVIPTSAPYAPQKRISMTLPLINKSRHVFLMGLGQQKAEVIHQILDAGLRCPAGAVVVDDGQLIYLLDRHAASKLTYVDSYSHQGDAVRVVL